MKSFEIDPTYSKLEEKDIVVKCQQGDLDAFNVLISRYEERVLNQAVRYLQDYHQALDEAQEVFIKVFKKIKQFKGDSAFGTWLYRVTANHCLTVINKRRNKNRPDNSHYSYDNVQEISGDVITVDKKTKRPDEVYKHKQLESEMMEALQSLSPEHRQIVVLRHYEELRYDQIAEIMDVPPATVGTCLYRARIKLKQFFKKKGGARK